MPSRSRSPILSISCLRKQPQRVEKALCHPAALAVNEREPFGQLCSVGRMPRDSPGSARNARLSSAMVTRKVERNRLAPKIVIRERRTSGLSAAQRDERGTSLSALANRSRLFSAMSGSAATGQIGKHRRQQAPRSPPGPALRSSKLKILAAPGPCPGSRAPIIVRERVVI